ncbi:PDDEXK family nuclease [Streptomyces mirabilis]|uniref:Holliday junction resolvase n=1 Tax=Streptomyces mirabilis TaxID=68239 RepID=UPI0036DA8A75
MNSNYERGVRFERAVRDDLESHGYEVIRSAGSKSKIDLVAIKPRQLLLIQCKQAGPGQLPNADWNRVFELSRMCDADPIVAVKITGRALPEYRRLLIRLVPRQQPAAERGHFELWSPDPLGER